MEFNKLSYPENWEKFTLSQVCTRITSGGTPSRKNEGFYKNGTIYWVKTKELENGYILDTEEKITELGLSTSSAKLLPKNTILLAMYGATVGELGILGKEMACNQACCALIVDHSRFDYRYLFYILKLHKEEFKQLATGAAQQNLSATTIKEFTFGFPELEKQKQIANILEALDDKIHLNTQTAQTLETIAQTIFKSWFVDFDPIHAKINAIENGEDPTLAAMQAISCKNPEELHRLQTENPQGYRELEKLANAFPSEIGEDGVPKGWEYKSTKELFDVGIGKTPPRKERHWFSNNFDDVQWISIKDMGNSGVFIIDSSEYLLQEAVDKFNVKVIPENTVILSFKLTVGRVGITTCKTTTNEAIAHFKNVKRMLPTEFLYCYLKDYDFMKMGSTSSIATAVNSKMIKEMLVLTPPKDIVNVFEHRVKNLFAMIKNVSLSNSNLEKIRDELLPRLLKGEF